MNTVIDWGDGILAVDTDYLRPRLAAVHLIIDAGRVAIVDTGVAASVPRLLAALNQIGLSAEAVDYLIVTHIHLDHAGGAGPLMRLCPQAQLVVHPRGARHMAEPSKLWAGVAAVYGQARCDELYGPPVPVDPEHILESRHERVLRLGGRELLLLDTPGHARHHHCLVDLKTGGIFTGDAFGLSYRELDCHGQAYVFPTTTPVQFDPAAMHASIDLILSFRPPALYPTHFSRIVDAPRLGADLHRLTDAHIALAERERNSGAERATRLRAGLVRLLLDEAERQSWTIDRAALLELFALDLDLNAQGLDQWLTQHQA